MSTRKKIPRLTGLTRALREPDPEIRTSAVIALAASWKDVPVDRVVPLLVDPHADVRAASAFALGKFGDEAVIPSLQSAWRATTPSQGHLRRQLLIALGDIGGAVAIEPAVRSFADLSFELQELVLDTLDHEPRDARRAVLSPIPLDATETVLARHPSGAKSRSEYRCDREVVADVSWEPGGTPSWAWGLRGGQKHGLEVEYWDNGEIAFVETWVDGMLHGLARHYDEEGKLLLETRFAEGTGVDLWCDRYNRTLAEETRIEGGRVRARRWWNPDQRSVYREELYAGRDPHGSVEREWNERGRLRRGFPRYFVRGQRVDKRTYLRRAGEDPTLPRLRRIDDTPRRKLPAEYIEQPVYREARQRR
jgi:hypothetical protein